MTTTLHRLLTFVTRGSLLKRTLLSVTGFGLGSLLIAGLLSMVFVGVAESVLPASSDQGAQPADVDPPAAAAAGTAAPEALADRRRDRAKSRRGASRPSLPTTTPPNVGDRPL
jgi:hypothetical protein